MGSGFCIVFGTDDIRGFVGIGGIGIVRVHEDMLFERIAFKSLRVQGELVRVLIIGIDDKDGELVCLLIERSGALDIRNVFKIGILVHIVDGVGFDVESFGLNDRL